MNRPQFLQKLNVVRHGLKWRRQPHTDAAAVKSAEPIKVTGSRKINPMPVI
jgi:hypothetical protein